MSKFINTFVNVVFIVFSGLIMLSMLVSIADKFGSSIVAIAVGLLLIVLLVMYLLFSNKLMKIIKPKVLNPTNKLSAKQLALIIFAFSFISKTVFVVLFGNDANLHPDMKIYLSFANQIADNGVVDRFVSYALRHSYTFIFGLFLSPIAKFLGGSTEVLNIYMSLLISIANVLLFDILKMYVNKRICFCGIMLYNILPIGLFQTQLLVHENAILFFHILSLWLFLKFFDDRYNLLVKIIFLVIASLVISFGAKINISGIVIIISMIIYSAVVLFKKITLKNVIKFVCILLSISVCLGVNTKLCELAKDRYIDKTMAEDVKSNSDVLPFGFGWGLYVGFDYDSNGTITASDADEYYKEFDNELDEKNYRLQLIQNRIENCAENPIKLINHFLNKLKILWGTPFLPFAYEQGNSINEFVLKGAGGLFNKIFNLESMFAFLIVYFMTFISSFKLSFKKNRDKYLNLYFKLVIIGLTLIFLFVEVTPKYTSHLPILMLAILILQIQNYNRNATDLISFIRKNCWQKYNSV